MEIHRREPTEEKERKKKKSINLHRDRERIHRNEFATLMMTLVEAGLLLGEMGAKWEIPNVS